MEWLVVKNKTNGSLFVQTRQERETMINALEGFKGSINSIVIKVCESEEDAIKYIDDINLSNQILEKIL